MGHAQAFSLHLVHPGADGRQDQIQGIGIQQVELIDVQHAPVCFCQQARLKHRAAFTKRAGDIHRSHQAVFRDAKRDLHKRRGDHPGGLHAIGYKIPAAFDDFDRRQQGMQTAGQHGFAGAAPSSDHHAPQGWIDRGQQQSQFQGGVAGDSGQREHRWSGGWSW